MFLCIVPLNVNSSKFCACPILCDLVVLFEGVALVFSMCDIWGLAPYMISCCLCGESLGLGDAKLSPHKHHEIIYGANHQMSHIEDTSPPLDEAGIKRIQEIVGAIQFYGRAVDNKLLVTLN